MSAQLKKQCIEFIEKINEIDDEDEKLQVTLTMAKSLIKNAVKKSDKTKKVKIPGAPPKGTNAFIIFCEEKRAEYVEDNPDEKTGAITKLMAEDWNNHRDEKDEVFEEYTQKLADRKEAYQAFLEENGIEEEPKGKAKSDKPTRAPSAYNLFMKEQQSIVKEENPDAGQKEIMKIIGGKWSELSAEEKAEYKPSDESAKVSKKQPAAKAKAPVKGKGKSEDDASPAPVKAKASSKGKGKSEDDASPAPAKAKASSKGKGKSEDDASPAHVKVKASSKGKAAPEKVKSKKPIIVEESDDE